MVYLVFYEVATDCWNCGSQETHEKLQGVYSDRTIAEQVAKPLFLGTVREQEVQATEFDE
jgi:hypothetical protein